MVDEHKYLNGIKAMLIHQGYKDIAQLLDGATCGINDTGSFSRKRWNCNYTIVYFNVPIKFLALFDKDKKEILREIADTVMPKDEQLDVMEVEITPLLDDMPNEPTNLGSILSISGFTPLFGFPSKDSMFQCDVFV